MPLNGMIIKTGATSCAPTGGTDETFSATGAVVAGGINVADAAVVDFRVRPNITFKARMPTLNGSGVYSKSKNEMLYVKPKILANGTTAFNLIRIIKEIHPESTAAESLELDMVGAQLCSDSDTANFRSTGALS